MKHILLLKVYFCAFALLSVSVWARTVSAEIDFKKRMGMGPITFTIPSDSSIVVGSLGESAYWSYSDYADSLDLFLMDEAVVIPEISSSSFVLHTDSPGFWILLDTTNLNYNITLDLEDTNLFQKKELVRITDMNQNFFVFQTNKGKYAFCHSQGIDTSYFSGEYHTGDVIYTLSKMYLTCEVQEDGTPTFDSIPEYSGKPDTIFIYEEPPLALPLLRLHTMQKQSTPSAPYRVNGTSANTSTATGIRVGKETTIRDK